MTPASAACLIALVHTDISTTADGWLERTEIQAEPSPSCPWIRFDVPAQAEWLDGSGRGRLSDDTKRKLRLPRWHTSERSADGSREVTVFLGDFLAGDSIRLVVERRWVGDTLTVRPGAAKRVELRLPSGVSVSKPTEDGSMVLTDTTAATAIDLSRGGASTSPVAPLHPVGSPAGDVARSRRMTLQIPDGDPQRLLYPGAGSSVRVEDFFTFSASTLPQSVPMELPQGAPVNFAASPEGAATLERGPDAALIQVLPWEGPVKVSISYDLPDAPTFGERAAGYDEYTVKAPGGHIAWEGDGWHLISVGKRPILPNQKAVLTGLDNRFRQFAIPEPGLPQELRGRARTWDLAADLRPTLFERAMPGQPGDALWPRKLHKARKSGLLTDTEAMLVLWLYGRQAGLEADWALARPAYLGEGYQAVPSGYTGALVRIDGGDEARWIDAACTVCAPFELRPELEGASVMSLAALRTPDPTPGRSVVTVFDDRVQWDLEGPAALRLRQWLQDVPPAERGRAIAERVAGPGSSLSSTSGIGDAGAPISVTVRRGQGVVIDPLGLPSPSPEGVWADWIGERRRTFSGGDAHEATLTVEPLTYTRSVEDGRVTEILNVDDRDVPPNAARAIDAIRRGVSP